MKERFLEKKAVITQFFFRFLDRIHMLLFRAPMGAEMRAFVKSLSITIIATVATGALLFLFNFGVARLLGPKIYGEYQLMLSVGGILSLAITFGLDRTMTKLIAHDHTSDSKTRTIIGNGIVLFLFFAVCTTILWFLFRPILANFFSPSLFSITVFVFGAAFSFWAILKAILLGFQRFRTSALLEICLAFLTFALFLILFKAGFHTPIFPLIAQGTSAVLIVIGGSVLLRKNIFSLSFEKGMASQILGLSWLWAIQTFIPYILSNIDRFIIQSFTDSTQVGIYVAYLNATFFGSNLLLPVFASVFFSTFAKLRDRKEVLRKIHILTKKIFLLILVVNALCLFILLRILGPLYPFDIQLFLLLPLNVSFFVAYQMYYTFISSGNAQGVHLSLKISSVGALLFVILTFFFVRAYGIHGAAYAGLLVNIALFILFRASSHREEFISESL